MANQNLEAGMPVTGASVFLLLRTGVAMCFIGHGMFGILQKREWLVFFDRFGIGESAGLALMPLVGGVDIAIGIAALLLPLRVVFLYATVWCAFTAALRPISGLGVAEFIERAGNYGVPVALLVLTAGQRWFARIEQSAAIDVEARLVRVCVWTTAALLAGHGWLALVGKPLLAGHLAAVGLDASLLPLIGALELTTALACLFRPSRALLLSIAVWKVASEALFPIAGAPIWEFIERGGSYVAPLAGAMLIGGHRGALPVSQTARRAAAIALGLALSSAWALAAQSSNLSGRLPASLLPELRQGGLVVACRHAITSHEREDRQPVDFGDPSTQRVLSAAGEAQAIALGKTLGALEIPFGPIYASPFDRTRRTADLMFGRVEVHEALSSASREKSDELRALTTGAVAAGSNRFLVTHQGLLYRSFPSVPQGTIGEGDCLVARPGGEVLARVKPDGWGGRPD